MPPALRAIARRQHGVFHVRQALRCGVSPAELERHRVSGEWITLQPDVLACAGTPLTHQAQAWAGVIAVGPPVAVGRRTAAIALRMDRAPVPPDDQPDIVVPDNRAVERLLPHVAMRRMRPSRFAAVHVHGLPVTPAALTLRELGMVIPRDWLRDMVSHALRRRTVTFSALASQLGRGWPGAGAMRDVLREVAPGYQVVWEGLLHRALTAAGLPLEPQVPVRLADGRETVLDLGNRRIRFGVEVDGLVSHLERFAADRKRDRSTRRTGWQVERVAVPELNADIPGVVQELLVAATIRAAEFGLSLAELRVEKRTA